MTDLKKNLNNNNNNLDALNSMLNNIFHLLNQIWNLEDDEILTNQNGNWNYYNKDWNENNINNHNYLYNQNLQNQFNSYINNIIFYDPVNSGRKMQLEYNINYYNKNNPENKIAYEFFDDISELTDVNLWGSETESVKNAADRLLRKYRDINIDKYYAIIKNISYYKFFGNDSHKLSNSPFDSISKFNIVNKKVRIILLENDETIEDFKTSKSYKNNKTWKFITGIMHNNDNLNIMNKLINDQISNTHNVNSNYSINNETVNIINLTNNSLFNNNKNPITSAYEFIIKST
ncbi:hypothetical protein NW062_03335 [Mycoplasmopsis cynos]|nr:hypothetical protein NW062_03335 [Mycoplasmopsis cynos]